MGQGLAGDLMVRNVQLKHSGKYVCAVQTEVDAVSAAADLTVRGTRPAAASLPPHSGHVTRRITEVKLSQERENIWNGPGQ